MTMVNMCDMLNHASANGYAVGAFNVVSLDCLEGILAAAENCQAPVILSLAKSEVNGCDIELLMPAVEATARRATVPVAIQFVHAARVESAVQAINLGCNGVRVASLYEAFSEHRQYTSEVTAMASACGVPVEGSFAYRPYINDADDQLAAEQLDSICASDLNHYVKQTGVSFLSISLAGMDNESELDFARLKQLIDELNIPLTTDYSAMLSDELFCRLIANGICKINHARLLSGAISSPIQINPGQSDSALKELAKTIKQNVCSEVERCLSLWGSTNRAAEVLTSCQPWLPVEHLIIYNVNGLDDRGAKAMMHEGRRVLAAIPGVLEVVTGQAIKQDAAYRYTWLVRFCHPVVIDSYRNHPAHVAFADQQFRPVAGERISIDYQTIESDLSN